MHQKLLTLNGIGPIAAVTICNCVLILTKTTTGSTATTIVPTVTTLIKKKIKFSSYIGKFRVEQLQGHI